MHLKILLPQQILLDQPVRKVVAEAENGSFCLLPRHIDFATSLTQGILSFETVDGEEEFVVIDGGTLVKREDQVWVATNQAFRGRDLGTLRQIVSERFQLQDEREQKARTALARLEADFVRRFVEMKE